MSNSPLFRRDAAHPSHAPHASAAHRAGAPAVILSFDVEEHYRIEAAASLTVPEERKSYYRGRMEGVTYWLLEMLAARGISATFYIVGELAFQSRGLVRDIAEAGHEVGSHGWDHRRVIGMGREEFREDARKSKDALEQVTGQPVLGFRAPTFSITQESAWALEVLVEEGYTYDSSIYPVRHDRYGMPDAPLTPFTVQTKSGRIVELPPLTLRLLWLNLPVGGGGYFRLLPNWLMRLGIWQMAGQGEWAPSMLYFHPWEFDPEQEPLPLGWFSRLRTYIGISGARERLERLASSDYRYFTAADVVRALPSLGLATFDKLNQMMLAS
jgi:polysaccharide deacetylase family protein (PEP-CTERM system associated)